MNKFRKFFLIAGIMAFGAVAVSCGDDEPDQPTIPDSYEESGNGTGTNPGGSTTSPTATYQIKTGTVHRCGSAKERNLDGSVKSYYGWDDAGPCIYEDFYVKYVLVFDYERDFSIAAFLRSGSYWSEMFRSSYNNYKGSETYYAILESEGKVNSLSEITDIAELSDMTGYYQSYPPQISPDHGYYGAFRITDTNEIRHIRILVTGYTLDESDALSSVNIQYQLYD